MTHAEIRSAMRWWRIVDIHFIDGNATANNKQLCEYHCICRTKREALGYRMVTTQHTQHTHSMINVQFGIYFSHVFIASPRLHTKTKIRYSFNGSVTSTTAPTPPPFVAVAGHCHRRRRRVLLWSILELDISHHLWRSAGHTHHDILVNVIPSTACGVYDTERSNGRKQKILENRTARADM